MSETSRIFIRYFVWNRNDQQIQFNIDSIKEDEEHNCVWIEFSISSGIMMNIKVGVSLMTVVFVPHLKALFACMAFSQDPPYNNEVFGRYFRNIYNVLWKMGNDLRLERPLCSFQGFLLKNDRLTTMTTTTINSTVLSTPTYYIVQANESIKFKDGTFFTIVFPLKCLCIELDVMNNAPIVFQTSRETPNIEYYLLDGTKFSHISDLTISHTYTMTGYFAYQFRNQDLSLMYDDVFEKVKVLLDRQKKDIDFNNVRTSFCRQNMPDFDPVFYMTLLRFLYTERRASLTIHVHQQMLDIVNNFEQQVKARSKDASDIQFRRDVNTLRDIVTKYFDDVLCQKLYLVLWNTVVCIMTICLNCILYNRHKSKTSHYNFTVYVRVLMIVSALIWLMSMFDYTVRPRYAHVRSQICVALQCILLLFTVYSYVLSEYILPHIDKMKHQNQ